MATSLQTTISQALQAQGVDSSAALAAAKAATTTISTLTSGGTASLTSAATKASSILSSSLSSIVSGLSSVSSLFSSSSLTTTLSSKTSDASKGTKEADNKIQSLSSDAASALANPVAFISKPMTDAIKGIDSISSGTGLKDYTSNMSNTELATLAAALGTTVTTSTDVLNAIVSVTNALNTETAYNSTARAYLNSNYTSTSKTVTTSTTTTYEASLMTDIEKALQALRTSDDINDVIEAGENLLEAILESLPSDVSNDIRLAAADYVTQLQSEIIDQLALSVNTITALMANSGISTELITTKLVEINRATAITGNSYNTYTSSTTSTENLGTAALETYNALYELAQTLCADVETPDVVQSSVSKDLYDLLLDLATDYDITDLLEQIQNCLLVEVTEVTDEEDEEDSTNEGDTDAGSTDDSTTDDGSISGLSILSAGGNNSNSADNNGTNVQSGTSGIVSLSTSAITTLNTTDTTDTSDAIDVNANTSVWTESQTYFDSRSAYILQKKTRDIATRGAVNTYQTVQAMIGPEQIEELRMDMVILLANMRETESNLVKYPQLLNSVNLTMRDLVYDDSIEDTEVIDAISTCAMCASGTTLVDNTITTELRGLTQGTLVAYASKPY